MNWLSQAIAVTAVNLRSVGHRLGASSVAVIGVGGVVIVFVAVLSIAEGFRATLATTGSPDTVIVMRGGTDTEMNSILSLEETRVIADAPGVERSIRGAAASAELFVVVDIPKRSTNTGANVPLRGVQPAAFTIRDRVRIIEGRRFQPGRNEVIAGRGATAQFAGLTVGSTTRWGETEWVVVGVFDAGGTAADSELWCDAAVLQPAYRRGSSFQSVTVKLSSPDAFDRFKDALTADPRVNVKVMRETDYYAEQAVMITSIIRTLGAGIAVLMGIGAIFAALNTMYSAVSARTREIATLRALGFGAGPVVVSVLAESMALGLAGGVLGGALAYVAFNGYQTSTMNWQSFSQVAFAFAVTPSLLAEGIAYSLLMGLAGGLFPAIRAARLPVARALREL